MTPYPLTDSLIEKIKSESHLIADANIDRNLLLNKVKRLTLGAYIISKLDEKTLIKLTSGLIGLYLIDQNQK